MADPLQKLRATKRWTRIGVYLAILGYGPLYLFVLGYQPRQVLSSWIVGFIIATLAIQFAFGHIFKLRKRSVYPGIVLMELSRARAVDAAAQHALSVIHRLLGLRASFLALGPSPDDVNVVSVSGISRRSAERLLKAGMAGVREAMRIGRPLPFAADAAPAGAELGRDERLVFVPVVPLGNPIGVLAVLARGRNGDVKDCELLAAIGSALGLSLENLRQKEELRQSEERYRTVVASAPIVLFALDRDGVFTLSQGKGLAALGLKPGQVVGQSVFELYRDVPQVLDNVRRALAGEAFVSTVEVAGVAFECWYSPLRDENGEISGVIGVATDITERKRAEDALRESEDLYRSLVETSPDAITLTDLEGKVLLCNEQAARLHGFESVEDLLGRSALDFIAPEDRRRAANNMRRTLELGSVRNVEYTLLTKDGRRFPAELSASLVVDAEGGPRAVIGVVRDVSERKRAEEALRESARRLREQNRVLAELAKSKALNRGDLHAAVREITEAAARTLGVERASVWLYDDDRSKIRCIDLFERSADRHSEGIELAAADYPSYFKALEEERTIAAHDARSDPRTREFTDSYLVPLGITSMIDAPIRVGGHLVGVICHEHVGPARHWSLEEQNLAGSMADYVSIAMETYERKRAEEAMRQSEEKYRDLVENISEVIYALDKDGRITYVSPVVEQIGGYKPSELIGRSFTEFIHPDDLPSLLQSYQRTLAGNLEPSEYRVFSKSGEVRWVRTSSRPIVEGDRIVGLRAVLMDITDRKQAEDALRESEERFRSLITSSEEGILAYDTDIRVTLWNPAMERISGVRSEEVLGRSPFEVFPFLDEVGEGDALRDAVKGKATIRSEMRYDVPQTGKSGYFESSHFPLFDGRGRIIGGMGIIRDITDRKQAEDALRESESLHRSLVDTSPDAVIRVDLEGNILMANRRASELLGFEDVEEVLGRDALEFIAPEDRRRVQTDIGKTSQAGIVRNIEYTLLKRDGTRIPAELSASAVVDAQGEPKAYICVVRDITDRKQAEETIKHLAYHDALTDLPNRTLFKDRLTQALAQARRKKRMVAILFLDLDRFKVVNDTVGHAEGDKLLRRVAERLAGLVREGDTVARVGGDEFTLLFPEVGGPDEAAQIADRVLGALQQPWALDGHQFHVTTSIGIALYPSDGEDAESLLRNADTAMYRAKEQGRNNYQLYTPAMNARIVERLALENSMRSGLERGEFVVHYQPQVDLHTGQVVGVEALVRWQHPERGLVLPADFIPVAEETGLIVPLGEWVLRTACAQNKAWQDAGLPPMRVAVNLSARQFQQRSLIDMVAQVLEETGLDPHWLQLEITEGIAMQDVDFTIAMLQGLREMGVQISIDDFGTGYSSLSYLKRFPIDAVKIDRSFVRDLTVDPNDAAIATTVITMAHNLKLNVIAEGVETEEQLTFLKQLQCDEMQGYLFSRPVPAADFHKMLARDRRRARARVAADSG